MWILVAAFAAGILGSGHCLGMCGPFVLMVASMSRGPWDNFARQLAYSLGRISTYSFMGAVAGWSAMYLHHTMWEAIPSALAVLAGAGLVVLGSGRLLGWPLWRWPLRSACGPWPQVANIGRLPGYAAALATGAVTAWIPCGVVYAVLATAAASSHPVWGAATMGAFGVGTAFPLILVGIGCRGLSVSTARFARLASAAVVIVAGVICTVRGAATLSSPAPLCPGCWHGDQPSSSLVVPIPRMRHER